MNIVLKNMATVFGLIAGLQAMDVERNELSCFNNLSYVRELTFTEKENVHKMLLMKQSQPEIPQDILSVIMGKLHDVTHINPVLNGELLFNGASKPFKIRDLVEDGIFNLSNPIFEDVSQYLVITTDPEKFFSINQNSEKLVILIAPRFLIKEKIESTAKHFKPILDHWKEELAPIGIFWRLEKWENLGWHDYLTSKNLTSISRNNLYENWCSATELSLLPWTLGEFISYKYAQKISCSFCEVRQG